MIQLFLTFPTLFLIGIVVPTPNLLPDERQSYYGLNDEFATAWVFILLDIG